MTDLRKAAEMAVKALDGIHVGNMTPMAEENWGKAIEALRQALAQPEHYSDCAVHNEPAYPKGECDCKTKSPEIIPTVPDNMQDWAKLDGATAWLLMERHANNWSDIEKMMDEFVAAKVALAQPEQPRCPRCGKVNPAEIHTCSPQVAQPEQLVEPPDYVEPVTFDYHDGWEEGFKAGAESIQNKKGLTPSNVSPVLHGGDKNYTELAQPEQEPVAWMYVNEDGECEQIEYGVSTVEAPYITLLYIAPPSKPWVSLTKDDYDIIFYKHDCYDDIARAIETALRSKNNG